MTKNKLHIGLVQQQNTGNTDENLSKLAANIADCARQGAELVVLQELHNSLYFCQVEDVNLFDLAEPIPGPSTQFYGELAQKHQVVLVTSLFEKRASGIYHNTAVVLPLQSRPADPEVEQITHQDDSRAALAEPFEKHDELCNLAVIPIEVHVADIGQRLQGASFAAARRARYSSRNASNRPSAIASRIARIKRR